MKNIIISFMGAWIFYGLCEVKKIVIAFIAFFVILELITVLDKIFIEIRKENHDS